MELTVKRLLKSIALCAAFVAGSASAVPVNVGGVIWDPESVLSFGSGTITDFTANGAVVETGTYGFPGDLVTGRGRINRINNFNTPGTGTPVAPDFCPGCELTYTFSMNFGSFGGGVFTFNNLSVKVFVDHTPDYNGSAASAGDGVLWLSLVGNGPLSGFGTGIGTGSDTGTGSALLDVTGGLAMTNFDTNTRLNGADMVFSSSFQPIPGGVELDAFGNPRQLLSGTVDLTANSIPEPSSLALVGAALLGFGALRRRR